MSAIQTLAPAGAIGNAVGQILPLAVGVAVSPIPIIAVVLMLASRRARANGPAFLGGWLLGLAALGAVVLLVSSGANASSSGAPATWVSVLKLVLGVLLLLVAVRQWRGRPRAGETVQMPGWMRSIDAMGSAKSLAMGAALAAINPKNGLMTIAAGAVIAQQGMGAVGQAVALAVFIVIASLSVAAPVAIYFALGDRAPRMLDAMQRWLSANNTVIMAILLLVIAAKLIGDGISGLSS